MFIKNLLCIIIFLYTITSSLFASTYYISSTGNDVSDGLSWGNAWATISKLNSDMAAGDTVFFGTGIYRDTTLIMVGGTYSDRTVYACSSFVDTNSLGEYHFAKLYGSSAVTGWTQIGATNVYVTPWSGSTGADLAVFQDDYTLWLQSDSANVNAAGEYYASAGNLIAWVNGGDDPDNYNIEAADRNIVLTHSQDYVTFYGLEFKNAHTRIFTNNVGAYSDLAYDSVFINHCKLSNVKGYGGVNPALINTNSNPVHGKFDRVVACSLSNVWATSSDAQTEWNTHGTGIVYYSMSDFTVDSNTFYGYFSLAGFYVKNDNGYPDSNSVIAYNTFENTSGSGLLLYRGLINYQVYGNIFKNNTTGISKWFSPTASDSTLIYNNTFYNCGTAFNHNPSDVSTGYVYDSGCEFKYNLIYDSDSTYLRLSQADTVATFDVFILDSNMYYSEIGDYSFSLGTYGVDLSDFAELNGNARVYFDTTGWRGLGEDIRSTFEINPSFNSAGTGDYSRPSASDEMSRVYGGKSWTIYGSWQPGDTVIVSSTDDNTPPSTIVDLSAILGDTLGYIRLSWTAPGDDGNEGFVDHYQIIVSRDSSLIKQWQYDYDEFNISNSDTAGVEKVVTVPGFEDGVEYFIAIKAFDELDNSSESSNIASSKIKPPVIISTLVDKDNFLAKLNCSIVPSDYDNISYQFQILNSLDVDTLLFTNDTSSGLVSVNFVIDDVEMKYRWRCRALESGKDTSNWSELSSLFSYSNIAPTMGNAISPLTDSVIALGTIEFIVENGEDSDGPNSLSYEFEISDEQSKSIVLHSSNIAEGNGTTAYIDSLFKVGTYSWRARCFDGIDYSDWTGFEVFRSEERRVGKECRSRWSPYHEKKKTRE